MHGISFILEQVMSGGVITLGAILLAVLLIKLFLKPVKLIVKILAHAASGFLLLVLVNLLGRIVGIHVDITWITALVSGFFGIPGVIGLIIFC